MTEEASFSEELSKTMLKDLQSWWEIPSTAQYISLFREPFNLPEIEIEELENGLIEDTLNGPSMWLRTLILAFLRSIMPSRINAENWEQQLRKLVKRKLPIGAEDPWPEEDKAFHELKIRAKVDIVYSLCLARLDRNDILDLMKSMDAEALRVQKLGVDDTGSSYWYFYGTRLYKEEAFEDKKSWNEEWKEQKKRSLKKRGRGRPRKRLPTSDGESDSFEDIDSKKNDSYMNVSEKSRWSVACDTIEEWVNFAEKFKNSKSKNELSLFKVIQENFLPTLSQIYEEKEKKLHQKIRDLMPLPKREKIVTRRETRRMRGEDVERPSYSDYFSDDSYKTYTVKDRAQRLEERNKRASEADCIQIPSRSKRMKNNHVDDELEEDEPEFDSSFFSRPEIKDVDWQAHMERLLSSVKLHKDAWPFLYPVNEEDAPGYSEIIKDPVDLSMIENKLFEGHYSDAQELDDDFSKMVANCELYNGEYHPYSKMGQMLWKFFREGVAKIFKSLKVAKCADSEGSSDSQYHSNPNSVSPPLESPTIASSKAHIKSKKEEKKERKKKKKHRMEALNLLAEASDMAVQDNFENGPTTQQKKSPEPQQMQGVPSTNMPYYSVPTNSSSAHKTSLPVTSSNFVPANNIVQKTKKDRPLVIKPKLTENRISPVQNVATTSVNVVSSTNTVNSSIPQNNIYQSLGTKTVPLMFSTFNHTSPSSQNDVRLKNNPGNTTSVQNNVCIPNGLPVVQQVLLPAGTQQIQLQNNGQFVFTSPQNVRLFNNKEQNVQILNNVRPVNQGFGKVAPQIVTSAPVLQVSKPMMQGLQFQSVTENNTQAYTQVTQNPQFVSIPTYMLTNQSTLSDSSSQPIMNIQSYQLPQRQLQINSQGNC